MARRPDGTIDLPDGFTARGVPAVPRLDGSAPSSPG
jgi:hypothetical protein